MPRTYAVVLAAGDGARFGADMPKQFLRLAGEQILVRTLRTIALAEVDEVIVVAHPSWVDETRQAIAAASLPLPVELVVGGATRNESTRSALDHLRSRSPDDIVIVHDAVRPLVPLSVIRGALQPILRGDADATDTVIPSADTLVIVENDRVTEIPQRSRFRRGQTPQVFRLGILAAAYDQAAAEGQLSATDDCSLVLRFVPDARVVAVAGDEINLKITTRLDLVLADRMLQMRTIEAPMSEAPARELRGSRILVVGGTNGIGRAVAELAIEQGASVEVDARSLGLDVRDHRVVKRRVDAAAERMGGIDHVIVTAGILRTGPLAEAEEDALAEVVEVNLIGSLNVARACYEHLRRSMGSFTVFASSSFTRGRSGYVAYSASKAGVVNVAQGLADEWAEDRIRVNAVSPERTDTPMRRLAFPTEPREGMLSAVEVAEATLSLLRSDLTGQVIDVRRHDLQPSR